MLYVYLYPSYYFRLFNSNANVYTLFFIYKLFPIFLVIYFVFSFKLFTFADNYVTTISREIAATYA